MTSPVDTFLDDEFGTDDELAAECRLLGSLMLEPSLWEGRVILSPLAFCNSFHATVYYTISAQLLRGQSALDPVTIWDRVKDHPDADTFGLRHLCELVADAADPKRYLADQLALAQRGLRRYLATEAATVQ